MSKTMYCMEITMAAVHLWQSCSVLALIAMSCLRRGEKGREDINRREGRGCCIVFRANLQTNKQMDEDMSTTTFEKSGRVYVTHFLLCFCHEFVLLACLILYWKASVRATHNFQKMHPTELHLWTGANKKENIANILLRWSRR